MKKSTRYISLGIFILSFASLTTEISLIRAFDVLFYPNIAYMIITCCLFAYGLAGVYSAIKPLSDQQDPLKEVGKLAVLLSIAVAAILPIMNFLPFNFNELAVDPLRQTLYFSGMYIAIAVPFFLSGRIFTTLFTVYAKQIQLLYFWDLAGAALGSISVIILVPWIGPGGSLLVIAAFALIASGLFVKEKKWLITAATISAVLIAIPVMYSPNYIDFKEHQGKRGVKLARETGKIEATVWDPISKIDVINYEDIRYIAYDGGSQTSIFYPFDGNFQALRTNLPNELSNHFWMRAVLVSHYLKQDTGSKVLIIGSAGGQEIKAALLYGAGHVDGVELVEAVVQLGKEEYAKYIGGLFAHPSVSVYAGEGRSYLRASQDRYDIIQIFSNHTSSSIAAGTGAVATNYLQTSDAYVEYFSHLTENGILHINHHYYPKMITTAAKAWSEMGYKDFYKHVVVYENSMDDTLPTFLVKMKPWSQEEFNLVKNFFSVEYPCESIKYRLVVDPINPENNEIPLEYFFGELSLQTISKETTRIQAATDNRPYFNFLPKSFNPFPNGIAQFLKDPMGNISTGLATLFIPGVISIFYAVVLIVFPLSFSKAGKQKWPNKGATLLYFALLGAGFIIIEFVFIQLFMRLIGSPLYTYSSVLFIILLSAGVGSFTSNQLNISQHKGWYIPFAGILFSVVLLMIVYPKVSVFFLGSPLQIRIGIALLMMFPIGFFLGMPFPLGILTLANRPSGAIAWAWGMNGLFTVVGGLLAIIFSIEWGFSITLLIACLLYVLALWIFSKIRRAFRKNE
jgi:spermidine synthase